MPCALPSRPFPSSSPLPSFSFPFLPSDCTSPLNPLYLLSSYLSYLLILLFLSIPFLDFSSPPSFLIIAQVNSSFHTLTQNSFLIRLYLSTYNPPPILFYLLLSLPSKLLITVSPSYFIPHSHYFSLPLQYRLPSSFFPSKPTLHHSFRTSSRHLLLSLFYPVFDTAFNNIYSHISHLSLINYHFPPSFRRFSTQYNHSFSLFAILSSFHHLFSHIHLINIILSFPLAPLLLSPHSNPTASPPSTTQSLLTLTTYLPSPHFTLSLHHPVYPLVEKVNPLKVGLGVMVLMWWW